MRQLALAVLALIWSGAAAQETVLVPRIAGPWWQIAGDPDVAPYTTADQQPVDFAIWQAADGTWQLWSCIRHTSHPGNTRLFYRWEAKNLTDRNWTPMGIAMTADTSLGETEGGLQAPYVMKHGDEYLMFYGDWVHIALATSRDGKNFTRRPMPDGKTGMFYEGTLEANTRDPMALVIDGTFHLYYTANPMTAAELAAAGNDYSKGYGADYVRTSTDLVHWSPSQKVAAGGAAGLGTGTAECPFVYYERKSGYYYLFRTQMYGPEEVTTVYRSKNPTDFGVNDDRYRVGTLPVAAPEIIEFEGATYIAALLPNLKGIRIARLEWVPQL